MPGTTIAKGPVAVNKMLAVSPLTSYGASFRLPGALLLDFSRRSEICGKASIAFFFGA